MKTIQIKNTIFAVSLSIAAAFNATAQDKETKPSDGTDAADTTADPVESAVHLPEDGAWVQYQFSGAELGKKEGGTGTFRMVGATTVDGETCRWIESQFEGEEEGKKKVGLSKFLVREKDFVAGATSVKILRGWMKEGEKAVVAMVDGDGHKSEGEMVLALFFAGPKDSEAVRSEKVIKLPKGQLKIGTATRGKTAFPEGMEATRTVWAHKEIPFGFAAMDLTLKSGDKTIYETTLTVNEHGTGAKSALPDHN